MARNYFKLDELKTKNNMKFYILDVFAENKYQGNQLSVLIPDRELSTEEMQQITREMNFSETAFIMSSKQDDGGYCVRIFTPGSEVPFAGHPTLGTAYLIQKLYEPHSERIILNLGVGQIPVEFRGKDKNELFMQQKQPTFGKIIEPNLIAEILNINLHDINTDFPIQVVSTGLPAVIIPIKTLAAVKKCEINHTKYQHFLDTIVQANLMVFTKETEQRENQIHARVFVDDPGFFEDPATGSANGNLAGYFLQHEFFHKNKLNLRVEQGYAVKRFSLLKIEAEKQGEKFHISVGGKVFLIAEGNWL